MAERLNALPWKGEKRILGASQGVVDILNKNIIQPEQRL